MSSLPDEVAGLLRRGEELSGLHSAEAFVRAAKAQRADNPVAAARAIERALAALATLPSERRRIAALEMALGAIYEQDLGRLDEAILHYQRAFKADTTQIQALEAGRRIYGSLGDHRMVAALFEVELDVTPAPERRATLLSALGRTLSAGIGDLPAAASRFEEAIRLAPDDEGARAALAAVYANSDFPPVGDGRAAPTRAIQLLVDLAARRQRAGDGDAALAFLRRGLGVDPEGAAAVPLEAALGQAGATGELRALLRIASTAIEQRALKRAALAEEAGDHEEAITALNEALDDPAQHDPAMAELDRLLSAARDHAGLADLRVRAAERLEGAAKADRLVEAADHLLGAGDERAAIERLESALATEPTHAAALARLTDLLTARKEFARLGHALEAAAEAAPLSERSARLGALAEHLEKRMGDLDAALEAWTRAEAIAPTGRGHAEARRLTLRIERSETQLATLARELESATDRGARAEAWRKTALLYRERHELETAAELYDAILEVRPGDLTALRALVDLWEREGDWPRTIAALQRLCAAGVPKVERLGLLRRIAQIADERGGRLDDALAACDQILHELPADREAHRRRVALRERAGDDARLREALEAFVQVASTSLERRPILLRLAAHCEAMGDSGAAAERLEQAARLAPLDRKAREALCRLLEAAGRWSDLAALLERELASVATTGHGGTGDEIDLWRRLARVVDRRLGDGRTAQRAERAWRALLERVPRDREALEALSSLARERNDLATLVELLGHRLDLTADPDEATALGTERADLLDQLGDPEGPAATVERLLAVAPRDLKLHARLRIRYEEAGDIPRAVRIAERVLVFCESPDERLEVALHIAGLWRDLDRPRAIDAFERVLEMAPGNRESLDALAALYAEDGAWRKLSTVGEQRLLTVEPEAVAGLLEELADLAEQRLNDPTAAWEWRRRAYLTAPGEEALARLEALAKKHEMWVELASLYEGMPALKARRALAMVHERLGEPRRALEVLTDALNRRLDGAGRELLPEIERLAEIVREPTALLEVYEGLIAVEPSPEVRLNLVGRRAMVREASGDVRGAFVDRLRQYALSPDDNEVLREITRLGSATRRWGDLLAVQADRFRRADPSRRLQIAIETAAMCERKMRDPVRAFRAALTAFSLAPNEPRVVTEVWRLARAAGRIFDGETGRRELTDEISLDDVESASGPALSNRDAVPRHDPALLLGEDELEPHGDARSHLAWEELEGAYLRLPAATAEERAAILVAVGKMWSEGAADPERGFAVLGRGLLIGDGSDARAALEELAEARAAWSALAGLYEDVAAESREPERSLALLFDAAAAQARAIAAGESGVVDDLEARFRSILGARPECAEALDRLEALYRQRGRLADLASVIERRVAVSEGDPAQAPLLVAQLAELGRTYEAVGSPYEALDAWSRLLAVDANSLEALRALVRLHEKAGQWSRTVDALDRLATAATEEEARAARRRRAEIFERELDSIDQATEAWAGLLAAGDETARAPLEGLYEKQGRHRDLDALLEERLEGNPLPSDERAAILERRAALLDGVLGDPRAAALCLRELRTLRPDDDRVARSLGDVLGRAGESADQAEVIADRVAAAQRRRAPAREQIELYLQLAAIQAGALEDKEEARASLRRALAIQPGDPSTTAALSRLDGDWLAYAAARVREAEISDDAGAAALALVDAGHIQSEQLGDDGAARWCFEQALLRVPSSSEARAGLGAILRRQGEDALADDLLTGELGWANNERRAELLCELAASSTRRGEVDEAERQLRAALVAVPGHRAALIGLADHAALAGRWSEVESTLVAATRGAEAEVAAPLWLRVATARDQLGRADEAGQALVEAERLAPDDLATRIALGENRFHAARWREAALHLGAVAFHPGAAALGARAADACQHAALAEQKLRNPERAEALLVRALELHNEHLPSLALLTELAVERGDLIRAVDLLEQRAAATADPAERAKLFESAGDLAADELGDPVRARAALRLAAEAAGPSVSEAMMRRRLDLARAAGDTHEAAALGYALVASAPNPASRAERLHEAAALAAAAGDDAEALKHLREALAIDPGDEAALAGVSSGLAEAGLYEEAAMLLGRALSRLAPPTLTGGAGRATLWRRLGEAQDRLGDGDAARTAFERALEVDPSLRELRAEVVARYRGDPAHDAAVGPHLDALVVAAPLDPQPLRLLAALEARRGDAARSRRLLELLAVAGAATDEELRAHRRSIKPQHADEPYPGALDEEDHGRIAHPDARSLRELFATLWEAAGAKAPGLDAFGLSDDERVSPTAERDVARVFTACARALGNRSTGLFVRREADSTGVALVAHPPTAVVVGARLAEGRASPSLRFLLGRALEMARPEFALGAALSPEEFARRFGSILRAFQPGSATGAEAAEASRWRRELPYKLARRLGELFVRIGEFPSLPRWRRAVIHTGNRAGLLLCGDLVTASALLRSEGDDAAVEEMARFAASADCVALQAKLGRRATASIGSGGAAGALP